MRAPAMLTGCMLRPPGSTINLQSRCIGELLIAGKALVFSVGRKPEFVAMMSVPVAPCLYMQRVCEFNAALSPAMRSADEVSHGYSESLCYQARSP